MKNQILEILKGATNVDYRINSDNDIEITINDFAGFNDEWEEEYQDFNDNGLLEFLEKNSNSKENDLYIYYQFDDFSVEVGYSSFDI